MLVFAIVEVKHSTEAKVNDLHIAAVRLIRGQQYVLRLEISVDDRLLVDVVHAFKQTFHDASDLVVIAQLGVRRLLVKSLELAPLYELHFNHDEPFVFVDLLEVHYGLVIERLHDLGLIFEDQERFLRQNDLVDYLERRFFLCDTVLHQQDHAESPHTKQVSHLVKLLEVIDALCPGFLRLCVGAVG